MACRGLLGKPWTHGKQRPAKETEHRMVNRELHDKPWPLGAVGGVEQTGNFPPFVAWVRQAHPTATLRDLAQRLRRHGAPLVPRERDEGYRRAERR